MSSPRLRTRKVGCLWSVPSIQEVDPPFHVPNPDLLLHRHSANFHESLGPCSVEVSSRLFAVGGAIFFSLNLVSPPSSLRVYALKVYFNQTTNITSYRDPTKTASFVKKVVLLEQGWAGPYTKQGLQKLQSEGKGTLAMLFGAVRAGHDEGFTLEEMTRLVSP
jgi:hypothetical protein